MRAAAVVRRTGIVVTFVVLTAACSMGSTPRRVRGPSSAASRTTSTSSTTTTSIPSIRYRVKRGDSLIRIANEFHEPLVAIARHNHIANPDRLAEGDVLTIDPGASVALAVAPSRGRPGQAFRLTLRGATPAETITFEIDSPAGKYIGGPHTASAKGTVTATYQPASGDPAGTYLVTATGTLGTRVQASFRLLAPPTAHT